MNETSAMQIFMIVTSQKGVIDMRAGFIGAGKVGFSLGKYLKENGVEITGFHLPFFLMVKTSVQISIRYIPYMQ